MKLIFAFFLLANQINNTQAQNTVPFQAIPSLEPSIGMVFRSSEKFSAARLGLVTRNLVYKNRMGFYYILEYRGGINYQEKGYVSSYYMRDIVGANWAVSKSFSVNAGVGIFRKGILSPESLTGLRKEVGISYKIPNYPVSIGIGYSNTLGPTATFGYSIPMGGKTLVDLPTPKPTPVVIEAPVVAKEEPKTEEPKTEEPKIEEVVAIPIEPKASIDLLALEIQSQSFYPSNIDTLDQADKDAFQPLITYLNENPKAMLIIKGNADNLGSESANLDLSLNRAKNVNLYLVRLGIADSRMKVIALGEANAKGETEEEMAKNRCVEFKIIP